MKLLVQHVQGRQVKIQCGGEFAYVDLPEPKRWRRFQAAAKFRGKRYTVPSGPYGGL